MRQQFVSNEIDAASGEQWFASCEPEVWDLCPWAAAVLECDGGWQAFESVRDSELWLRQI